MVWLDCTIYLVGWLHQGCWFSTCVHRLLSTKKQAVRCKLACVRVVAVSLRPLACSPSATCPRLSVCGCCQFAPNFGVVELRRETSYCQCDGTDWKTFLLLGDSELLFMVMECGRRGCMCSLVSLVFSLPSWSSWTPRSWSPLSIPLQILPTASVIINCDGHCDEDPSD